MGNLLEDLDETALSKEVKSLIKNFPDFPSKGVLFRDVLPLFTKPSLIRSLNQFVAKRYQGKVDAIVALEARGFLFGPIIALELGIPFVPARKKGKLPGPVSSVNYIKEYGKDTFEIQKGAITQGQRVLLLDDLIASGGSIHAVEQLIREAGAQVAAIFVIVELEALCGRKAVDGPVDSLVRYSD